MWLIVLPPIDNWDLSLINTKIESRWLIELSRTHKYILFLISKIDIKIKMLSISQKACDKVRIFMQNNRANCITFAKQHISMTSKSTPKVQLIYELCQKTFTPSGLPTPSPQAIQKLSSLLGMFIFPFSEFFNLIFFCLFFFLLLYLC